MKLLSTVALAIAIAAVPGPCPAQSKAAESRPAAELLPSRVTGKVTHVDSKSRRFTLMTGGKSFTFGAARLRSLPTVGDQVTVTYVVTRGGTMQAANLNLSKSNVD